MYNDLYEIEGIPPEFSGMNAKKYAALLKSMPLGDRLKCQASWRERLFVAEFLATLEANPNPLEDHLPKGLSVKPLTRQQRYVCLGIIRWFGTNCGYCLVEEVLERNSGKFFSVWDGQDFWSPGSYQRQSYSLAQLLDPDPGGLGARRERKLPFPNPTQSDRELVTALMRWLSNDDEGGILVRSAMDKIRERYRQLREERRIENQRVAIEARVSQFRMSQYQEAGLNPA